MDFFVVVVGVGWARLGAMECGTRRCDALAVGRDGGRPLAERLGAIAAGKMTVSRRMGCLF